MIKVLLFLVVMSPALPDGGFRIDYVEEFQNSDDCEAHAYELGEKMKQSPMFKAIEAAKVPYQISYKCYGINWS